MGNLLNCLHTNRKQVLFVVFRFQNHKQQIVRLSASALKGHLKDILLFTVNSGGATYDS